MPRFLKKVFLASVRISPADARDMTIEGGGGSDAEAPDAIAPDAEFGDTEEGDNFAFDVDTRFADTADVAAEGTDNTGNASDR